MLNIVVESQTALIIYWSDDKNNGAHKTKFEICRKDTNFNIETCTSTDYWSNEPSLRISDLQPATQYAVTVARYNGQILGYKRQEVAITRSG